MLTYTREKNMPHHGTGGVRGGELIWGDPGLSWEAEEGSHMGFLERNG
jgi:hypothetical protein